MARDFAKSFYKSAEWESMRQFILIRDKYKCQICGQSGALEVHHKTHLTPENINNSAITLNDANLITLCRDCHFATHKDERLHAHRRNERIDCNEELMFDENGFLIKKNK